MSSKHIEEMRRIWPYLTIEQKLEIIALGRSLIAERLEQSKIKEAGK